MKKVVASIMCGDALNLQDELNKLSDAKVDWLHCDVMDGVYVNNLAMGPDVVKSITNSKKFVVDVHLATVTPEKYIDMYAKTQPDYLTFHIETSENVDDCISQIREYGIKVGIAINPETSWKVLKPYMNKIDLILFMTVNPGFAGQAFKMETIEKLQELDEYLSSLSNRPMIEVDGNIYDRTIQLIKNYGVNLYVLGTSALFNSEGSYEQKINKIYEIISI